MKKRALNVLAVLAVAGLCWASALAASIVMPLEQIKPGMKGKGKTVFEGSTIEEFDVEILGVIYNVQPKKNVILARLKGKSFDTTGVIAGMSGSPIYIDGKIIGAIAFSFTFSKEPIAGITPIGEMLAVSAQKERPKTMASPRIPFQPSLSLEDLFEIHKNIFPVQPDFFLNGQACVPLRIPLVFGGFSSPAVEKARPLFSRLGFFPVLSGGGGQVIESTSLPDMTVREGDAVSLQLISGDLDLSALGTITYVDGNNVLAFGHPMYNLGAVDFAMARAKVLTIVPSLQNSFKVATTGGLIGKFTQDRTSGVSGEVGKIPKLIPLNVKLGREDQGFQEFKVNIVNDKILSPLLVNLTVFSILSSEERTYGDLSLEFEADVYLENASSVHLEDLYSGNFNTSVQSLSNLLTAVVYFLINNEFRDVGIFRIDLTVKASERARFSYLERVWLNKYEVSPGERIEIKVFSRTFRGESLVEEVEILTPSLPSGSEFKLIVADATSMHQFELGQYKTQSFVSRSFYQLIRILNNLRKNNRVYFKIISPKPGLFLKGEEMPNLPPTMKLMFTSPRAATSSPTELNMSTLGEYQLPVKYVFNGIAVIPIQIRK
ncbi:MAG: SpoIVB peptidase S55 domain-containing protein [Candidatus Aminicenantales bacterium]